MKHIFLATMLLMASCTTTTIPPEPTPTPSQTPGEVPSGYIQFCLDFPNSLLCE